MTVDPETGELHDPNIPIEDDPDVTDVPEEEEEEDDEGTFKPDDEDVVE